MVIEVNAAGEAADAGSGSGERRMPAARRGKDRRRSGNRINASAPRRSLMKLLGAYGLAVSGSLFALILLAGAMLADILPVISLGLAAAAMGTSIVVLALGALEERLIEVRLELMMLNGGMRKDERRRSDRRSTATAGAKVKRKV